MKTKEKIKFPLLKDKVAKKLFTEKKVGLEYLRKIISLAIGIPMDMIDKDIKLIHPSIGINKNIVNSEADVVLENGEFYVNLEINYYNNETSDSEEKYENVIDNYWQQEFLFHGFPFCLKGSFMHNYFAYLISYKIWEMYLYGYLEAFSGELKREKLLDLVAGYSKKLDHINKYIEYLIEHIAPFEQEPLKLMQVFLRLK